MEGSGGRLAGQRLFTPEKGGTYEVFLERPLSTPLQEYCAQDVVVMPKLLIVYGGRVPHHLAEQINAETLARVVLSQSENFNGKGPHMAVGPSFNRGRSRHSTAPEFPIILVCSTDLADRCALEEVGAAEASIAKELSVFKETTVTDSVEEVNTASTMDALLPALNSLEIGGPSSGRPAEQGSSNDEQENEFESHGYLDLMGHGPASDTGSEQDFTACSGSDCGWCGLCDY